MTIAEPAAEKIKISELIFDETNPNKMNKQQMQALRESMQRFGYLTPIIIDQNNKIADGEHRALVYQENGIEEIPAFRLQLNDDIDRRLLRQTMNKLRGEHDRQLDATELALIFKADKLDDLVRLVAQDKEDIQRLILRYNPGLDFVTPENEADVDRLIDEELKRQVPDTQLGDLYQLGKHRLICADATDKRAVTKVMNGNKANVVFIDPPYNLSYQSGTWSKERKEKLGRIQNDNMEASEFIDFLETSLRNILDNLEDPADQYVCCDWKVYHLFRDAILRTEQEISTLIVWNKEFQTQALNRFANAHEFILFLGDNRHPYKDINVWSLKREFDPEHPTPKPLALVTKALGYSSGKSVIDFFVGTGTTFIACEQTGRKCYGIEIDPHYCDVIIKRWEKYTGKKALKLS